MSRSAIIFVETEINQTRSSVDNVFKDKFYCFISYEFRKTLKFCLTGYIH